MNFGIEDDDRRLNNTSRTFENTEIFKTATIVSDKKTHVTNSSASSISSINLVKSIPPYSILRPASSQPSSPATTPPATGLNFANGYFPTRPPLVGSILKNVSNSNSITSTQPGSSRTFIRPISKAKSTPHAPPQSIVDERKVAEPQLPSLTFKSTGSFNHITLNSNANKNNDAHNENIFSKAPYNIVKYHKGNGGLRNAITRTVQENAIDENDIKWVGTIGIPTDLLNSDKKQSISKTLDDEYNEMAVFPTDLTFEGGYYHYCKQILWPTLHYQIPDNPKAKAYEDHSWEHYKLLNQLFANKVIETYKDENDIIWIHDYHLLLVPQMIREKLPNAKIGFFLHISFPSSEVFRVFACRKQLLLGMLGANCIGFQTEEYTRHFLQTCNRILQVDVTKDGIISDGKFISVVNCALGIDPPSVSSQIVSESVTNARQLIRERWPNQTLIVGRDKLDSIRGIKNKLLAYEEFLKSNNEFIDKTVLVQVCFKGSREIELESDIMQIVDRINGLSKNLSLSQPVVFFHQDIDFDQYLALLCEADAFVVTSLREGMNLTCHEFVICSTERKGSLILSEFTGSAAVLEQGALLVNPWDKLQVSEAFKAALTMPYDMKYKRWKSLSNYVVTHTGINWCRKFLKHVNIAWIEQETRKASNVPKINSILKDIKNKYDEIGLLSLNLNLNPNPNKLPPSFKRVFFLNLESNAVVPKSHSKSSAVPISLERKIATISELASDPNNIVYITSYIKKDTLERIYKRIPNIGLIAEDGGYIKPAGSDFWLSIVNENELEWKKPVLKTVESMVERLPGSFVEVFDCSIRFHTGTADDQERAKVTVGECISHVNDLFASQNVHANVVDEVVVIQPHDDLGLKAAQCALDLITQGRLDPTTNYHMLPPSTTTTPMNQPVEEIMPTNRPSSIGWIFAAGGTNPNDEPIFDYINLMQNIPTVTVSVAQKSATSASVTSEGVNELLTILKRLAS